MLTTSLLLAAAFLPQGGGSTAPAVINEFSYDDTGTDTVEFVEIHNRSGAPLDIGDWRLRSADPSGPNFDIAIPLGTVLPAGGFWVIGQPAVPNVNQNLTGTLENDNESITLVDALGNVVDTLIYESNKGLFDPTLAEGEGIWANMTLSENANPMSWSRVRDGYDSNNNGVDFRLQLWTPGASNDLAATPLVVEDFDALTVGANVAGWSGSFVNPRVIDPTVADGNNPSAIPASPQGGNAAIVWDPSGGGNAAATDALSSSAAGFEALVYLDANLPTGTDYESWSIGLGTVGSLYNTPDPSGALGGFTANGNTGVAWTFQRTASGAALYLIDHNDGGWGPTALSGPTILAQLPLTAGVDDGWQRLALEVVNGQVQARFGGTLGQPNGTAFSATVAAAPRGLYIGYREFFAVNANTRAFTFDALTLRQCPDAANRSFGTALASSASVTPTLGSDPLAVGTTATLTAASFLPNAPVFVLLGLERATPLTFGALAPAGFGIWVDAFGDLILATDGSGVATFPIGVPADLSLCGFDLATQAFQVDPGYAPLLIPGFHTAGLVTTIGA